MPLVLLQSSGQWTSPGGCGLTERGHSVPQAKSAVSGGSEGEGAVDDGAAGGLSDCDDY